MRDKRFRVFTDDERQYIRDNLNSTGLFKITTHLKTSGPRLLQECQTMGLVYDPKWKGKIKKPTETELKKISKLTIQGYSKSRIAKQVNRPVGILTIWEEKFLIDRIPEENETNPINRCPTDSEYYSSDWVKVAEAKVQELRSKQHDGKSKKSD